MTNTIEIDGVDLPLLNKQRRELHELLLKLFPEDTEEKEKLWGLLSFLDHICDKYDTIAFDPEHCEHAFSTDGENGICMFCGIDEVTAE